MPRLEESMTGRCMLHSLLSGKKLGFKEPVLATVNGDEEMPAISTSQDENPAPSIMGTPSTIITARTPLTDITNYASFGATQNYSGTVTQKGNMFIPKYSVYIPR